MAKKPTIDPAAAEMIERAVSEKLGWDPKEGCIRAVREDGECVEVTGTMLKPEEWRHLIGADGQHLPDGRYISVVHRPARSSIGLSR